MYREDLVISEKNHRNEGTHKFIIKICVLFHLLFLFYLISSIYTISDFEVKCLI